MTWFFRYVNLFSPQEIVLNGYKPPVSTQIMLGVSLALMYVTSFPVPVQNKTYRLMRASPVLAYAQHRIFKHPFSRKRRPDSEIGDSSVDLNDKFTEPKHRRFLGKYSRFSM